MLTNARIVLSVWLSLMLLTRSIIAADAVKAKAKPETRPTEKTKAAVKSETGNKTKPKPKTIDPVYLAKIEAQMWQAYYGNNKIQLGLLLLQLLNQKYQMPPMEAAKTANYLALAAMKFKAGRESEQYKKAIPDLVNAYRTIKPFSGLDYDPKKVAEAELAWWVDRRTPGKKKPKEVGKSITYLYETVYGYKHEGFVKAGQLRAQAAKVRDQGGKNCDWKQIEKLLLQSYQALKKGVEKRPYGEESKQ